MEQARIKELLTEASAADCEPGRLNSIQAELAHETAAMNGDGVFEVGGPEAGLLLAAESLFVAVTQNRREALPSLFPAFAVLCGDREEGLMVADVDWSLVNR